MYTTFRVGKTYFQYIYIFFYLFLCFFSFLVLSSRIKHPNEVLSFFFLYISYIELWSSKTNMSEWCFSKSYIFFLHKPSCFGYIKTRRIHIRWSLFYLIVSYILGGIQVIFKQGNACWNTPFIFFFLSSNSGTRRIPKSRMDSSGTKFSTWLVSEVSLILNIND